MRWIIAGSRDFSEPEVLLSLMSAYARKYGEPDEVISGGAKGADTYGESWTRRRDIPVKQFLPDWEKYGTAAGPIRNSQMAEYAGRDGILFLFWNGSSAGSRSMKTEAEKRGIKVVQFISE